MRILSLAFVAQLLCRQLASPPLFALPPKRFGDEAFVQQYLKADNGVHTSEQSEILMGELWDLTAFDGNARSEIDTSLYPSLINYTVDPVGEPLENEVDVSVNRRQVRLFLRDDYEEPKRKRRVTTRIRNPVGEPNEGGVEYEIDNGIMRVYFQEVDCKQQSHQQIVDDIVRQLHPNRQDSKD